MSSSNLSAQADNIATYAEFFDWCKQKELQSDKQISIAFSRTPQTVRNWKKPGRDGAASAPPRHLYLACVGFEILETHPSAVAALTDGKNELWFQEWRQSRGLLTLETTGQAFGLTRQAIHNWDKRSRLPRWLPLACVGYDHVTTTSKDNSVN